jgi:hypothetical protein
MAEQEGAPGEAKDSLPYKDERFEDAVEDGEFTAQVNPEKGLVQISDRT